MYQKNTLAGLLIILSLGCSFNAAALSIEFLTKQQAVQVLAAEDDYIKGLSQFDIQAKFKMETMPSIGERVSYYANNSLNWSDTDKIKINTAVEFLDKKIKPLKLKQPKQIKFILTTGNEEGGANYTRSNSIIFPKKVLTMNQEAINMVLAHEFFHVYSRYNQDKIDKIYAIVGYQQTGELTLPPKMEKLKISNPDAPKINYYINLKYKGKPHNFMPVLLARKPYEVGSNKPFFYYLNNLLLAVDITDNKPTPITTNAKPLLVDTIETNFEQIAGNNTEYLLHPEEIMAENFSLWAINKRVKNPEYIKDLIAVMKGK